SGAGGGWTYDLQYASDANEDGEITNSEWVTFTPSSNTTSGLTQTGTITYDPPSGWDAGTLDADDPGQPHLFYVRFKTTHSGTAPQANTIWGTDFVGAGDQVPAEGSTVTGNIPFFRANLDANHDGYLNDTEFGNPTDPWKYARFYYQSRLFYG